MLNSGGVSGYLKRYTRSNLIGKKFTEFKTTHYNPNSLGKRSNNIYEKTV